MAIDYSKEHNVDKSVVMTVAGAANCRLDYNAFAKGDGGMCTLFDKILKDGEAIGELKGRAAEIVETGYEFGISEADILKRLQQKLEIPLQVAQEYLKMFPRRVYQEVIFLSVKNKCKSGPDKDSSKKTDSFFKTIGKSQHRK